MVVVLVFTSLVTLFALNSHLSIFHMVENAYKVTRWCRRSCRWPSACLEAGHPPGRSGRDPAWPGLVADLRDRLCRCHGATANGRVAVLDQRDGIRVAAASMDQRSAACS
jgi:hypothetical protein